jgi:hypothetical protein
MLRYRADLRTIAFVATYFGLTAILFLQHHRGGVLPLAAIVPLFVLTSWFSFFGAVATHNTVHCPVFKQRPLNRLFQIVLTLTYGHPVSAFVPGYNLSHHKHTQTARDVMRTSKVRYRWNALNGLLFLVHVGPAIMKGENEYYRAMAKRSRAAASSKAVGRSTDMPRMPSAARRPITGSRPPASFHRMSVALLSLSMSMSSRSCRSDQAGWDSSKTFTSLPLPGRRSLVRTVMSLSRETMP